MGEYAAKRVIRSIPVLFAISLVTFFLVLLLPGDPVMARMAFQDVSQEQIERARHEMGLDRPIVVQYGMWLGKALKGDLGYSYRTQQRVTHMIVQRLPVTLQLTLFSFLVAVLVAIPGGIISAVRRNSAIDMVVTLLSIGGVAMPVFWLGILLIMAFAVHFRLLPATGYAPFSESLTEWAKHWILPSVALGSALAAVLMRMTRSSMLEVLGQDYIRTARAKGLTERVVIGVHALKNALLPVLTISGLQIAGLLSGTVVVETIFALPGMGRLAVDSVFARDFAVVQGVVLLMTVAVIMVNLLTDILYAYVDPRIRYY